MTPPSVIGLDLSMTATGIAYPDGTTETLHPRSTGDARLVEIRDRVDRAASDRRVDLVVIEDLPTHARAAGITGMVHGAVRSLLVERQIPYALVSPATLKAYAAGKGNADKTAMTLALYKRAGIEVADDNQCDAWWLRAAGLQHLGHPAVELPAAQIARLDKVTWPEVAVA
ncbi:hypothetical protein GCM10027294_25410 [Marinactinospora endophytica]